MIIFRPGFSSVTFAAKTVIPIEIIDSISSFSISPFTCVDIEIAIQ